MNASEVRQHSANCFAEILPAFNNHGAGLVLILIGVVRKMKRFHLVALTLGFLLPVAAGVAQNRGPMPLRPGDRFPEIDVHDASGKKFNTKSLKGKYTVIVNGCLT
jgi:hypothetical protein